MAYKICEGCENHYIPIINPDDYCFRCRKDLENGKARQEKVDETDSDFTPPKKPIVTVFCANCQMIDDVKIHCCYEGMEHQDRIRLAEIEIEEMNIKC